MPSKDWETVAMTPHNFIRDRRDIIHFISAFILKQQKKAKNGRKKRLKLVLWVKDVINKKTYYCTTVALWDLKNFVRIVEKDLKRLIKKPDSRLRTDGKSGERWARKSTGILMKSRGKK